jgi:hypothetical protein
MLEALVDGEVSFVISFAPQWERQPAPFPPVRLATSDLPKLEVATRSLAARGAYEQKTPSIPGELEELPEVRSVESFVLRGHVIALRRPVVTVQGFIWGEQRRVRVVIDDDDVYRQLAAAHAEQLPVRIVGRLVVRPRTASMMEAVASVHVGDVDA